MVDEFPISFDPTGQWLAWVSDESIVIWHVERGSELRRLDSGFDFVSEKIMFSSDGSLVAAGRRLWATEDGSSNPDLSYESPAIPLPDRQLLIGTASSFDSLGRTSSQLQFLRLPSGRLTDETGVVEGRATSLAISPDGSVIASGHEDGSIHFWDAESAAEVGQPFRGPRAAVTGLAFSVTDGTLGLVSTGERGAVRWSFDPANWTAVACDLVGRNLSDAEWEALVGSGTGYHETCPGIRASAQVLTPAEPVGSPSTPVASND